MAETSSPYEYYQVRQKDFVNNSFSNHNNERNFIKDDNRLIMQIQHLEQVILVKDKEIFELQSKLNDLNYYYKEQLSQYEIDKNNLTNKLSQQTEQYNQLILHLQEVENKLIHSEEQVQNYKNSYDLNDNNNKSNQLIITNLQKENEQMKQIYLHNMELTNEIKSLKSELENSNTTINLLQESNMALQNKINTTSLCFKQNENELKSQIAYLNDVINTTDKQIQTANEECELMKTNYKKINIEIDSYTSYVSGQINNLSIFVEQLIESIYNVNKNEIEKSSCMNKQNKDIKYEIANNIFAKIKLQLYDFVKLQRDIQNKLIKNYDESNTSNEKYQKEISQLKEAISVELKDKNNLNDKLSYKEKQFQELENAYKQTKELYNKLFHDYSLFTNKNEQFINETNKSYGLLLAKFSNIIKYDENDKDVKLQLSNTIEKIISLYKEQGDKCLLYEQKEKESENDKKENEKKVNEYKNTINNLKKEMKEEIEKQQKMSLNKIKTLTHLLDDTKDVIKQYEQQNLTLRNENQKLNYRYQMLMNKHKIKMIDTEDHSDINSSKIITTSEQSI